MLKGFVWRVQPPALVFGDFRNWETVAHICLWWIMTWLGDGLVVRVKSSTPLWSVNFVFLDLSLLGGVGLQLLGYCPPYYSVYSRIQ